MVGTATRILVTVFVTMVLSVDIPSAFCEGWSLPNPFAGNSTKAKNGSTKKTQITKVSKKNQSLIEKLNEGTKNFFDKTGETLGLKKAETKRPQYAIPKNHSQQTGKKTESKSWWQSLAPYDEEKPQKPQKVTDWMAQPRQDI